MDLREELRQFGIEPLIHDPIADAAETKHEYGLPLSKWEELDGLDALVVAVSHKAYAELSGEALAKLVKPGGVIVDVRSSRNVAATRWTGIETEVRLPGRLDQSGRSGTSTSPNQLRIAGNSEAFAALQAPLTVLKALEGLIIIDEVQRPPPPPGQS